MSDSMRVVGGENPCFREAPGVQGAEFGVGGGITVGRQGGVSFVKVNGGVGVGVSRPKVCGIEMLKFCEVCTNKTGEGDGYFSTCGHIFCQKCHKDAGTCPQCGVQDGFQVVPFQRIPQHLAFMFLEDLGLSNLKQAVQFQIAHYQRVAVRAKEERDAAVQYAENCKRSLASNKRFSIRSFVMVYNSAQLPATFRHFFEDVLKLAYRKVILPWIGLWFPTLADVSNVATPKSGSRDHAAISRDHPNNRLNSRPPSPIASRPVSKQVSFPPKQASVPTPGHQRLQLTPASQTVLRPSLTPRSALISPNPTLIANRTLLQPSGLGKAALAQKLNSISNSQMALCSNKKPRLLP
eukprot:758314-Hanusia_phi.AAC.3